VSGSYDRFAMKYILNPDHSISLADLKTWATWFEDDPEARNVALTCTERYDVSTVFLGLDHNFTGVGPPILFETMVFPKYGDMNERACERYATWDEAVAGHERMVRKTIAMGVS
jgi:hypothetical protein